MNWSLVFAALAVFVAIRMSLTGIEMKPVSYSYAGPAPVLEENTRLVGKFEKMLKGQVCGPEHYAFKGDYIYAGMSTSVSQRPPLLLPVPRYASAASAWARSSPRVPLFSFSLSPLRWSHRSH